MPQPAPAARVLTCHPPLASSLPEDFLPPLSFSVLAMGTWPPLRAGCGWRQRDICGAVLAASWLLGLSCGCCHGPSPLPRADSTGFALHPQVFVPAARPRPPNGTRQSALPGACPAPAVIHLGLLCGRRLRWGEVLTSARAGAVLKGGIVRFPRQFPCGGDEKCVFWQIFCFIVVACGGAAPSSRRFDKAPEDSVKKLCLVIVVVVSDHN